MQPPKSDEQRRAAATEVVPASERLLAGLGRGASAAWMPAQPEIEKVAPGFWEASDRPSNLVQCANSCVCCLAVVILIVSLSIASAPAGGGTADAVAPVIAMCCLMMVVAGVGIVGACGYCCDLLPTAGEGCAGWHVRAGTATTQARAPDSTRRCSCSMCVPGRMFLNCLSLAYMHCALVSIFVLMCVSVPPKCPARLPHAISPCLSCCHCRQLPVCLRGVRIRPTAGILRRPLGRGDGGVPRARGGVCGNCALPRPCACHEVGAR